MYKKFSIHYLKNPTKPAKFKIWKGRDTKVTLIRLDIYNKAIVVVYRKKAYGDYLRDISYEYQW